MIKGLPQHIHVMSSLFAIPKYVGQARVEMRSNCWQHESTSPLLNTAIICKLGSTQQQFTLLLLRITQIIDTDYRHRL